MATETIEERIPIAKVRNDLDAVIERARETKRPIIVTNDESAAIVILDAEQYQREQEKLAYLQGIIAGMEDVLAGRVVTDEEVEVRLDALLAKYQKVVEERDLFRAVAEGNLSKKSYTLEEVEAHLDALLAE